MPQKNRLNLDFSLPDNQSRAEFVRSYVQRPEFTTKPLTQSELNTIADYILWGRNSSGKNDVQEKLITISTKHGTWDDAHETESLDSLIESPTFNEAQLSPHPTHYTKPATKFSREEALAHCSPELTPRFTELFNQIDHLDLVIELYEEATGKRTKPIREELINRFSSEEIAYARAESLGWTPYHYLKQRHDLVELRREQYTLRDSFANPITRRTAPLFQQAENHLEWDADIVVRPLGLSTSNSSLIFRPLDQLNPSCFDEQQLTKISQYYWSYHDKTNPKWVFDFRELEHVYQLFLAFYDVEDTAAAADIENNSQQLLDTLAYYIDQADLDPIHRFLLMQKIARRHNQDIADEINQKWHKNYTANYISTLFRQKIIPQINAAARIHEEVLGKIYFPEEFKVCSCCGRTYLRTAEFFVRKSRSRDGLSSRCKKCDRKDRQEKKEMDK